MTACDTFFLPFNKELINKILKPQRKFLVFNLELSLRIRVSCPMAMLSVIPRAEDIAFGAKSLKGA
jgi:hypothetical protein